MGMNIDQKKGESFNEKDHRDDNHNVSSEYGEGNILSETSFKSEGESAEYCSPYVREIRERIYQELKRSDLKEDYIEDRIKSIDLNMLDSNYVKEQVKIIQENENLEDKGKDLEDFYKRVEKANDKVYAILYHPVSDSPYSSDIIERICNSSKVNLKENLSNEQYEALILALGDYLDDQYFRNKLADVKIEYTLFSVEMSTIEPFPLLNEKDRVNYLAGQIYAAIAFSTGKGFREAMRYLTACSSDAFSDKKGRRCEDFINGMLIRGEFHFPRTLFGFGPVKDGLFRELISAAKLYEDGQIQEAFDKYYDLFVRKKGEYSEDEKGVYAHIKNMMFRCLKILNGE